MIVVNAGHAHRKAAGGYALTDLAGGWALTAGPQQTLSSAGVVASGPFDLAARSGSFATPAYDAGGYGPLDATNIFGAWLQTPEADPLVFGGSQPVLMTVRTLPGSGGEVNPVPYIGDDNNGVFGLSVTGHIVPSDLVFDVQATADAGSTYPEADDTTVLTRDTPHVGTAWWDGSKLWIQTDGGTPVSQDFPGPISSDDPLPNFILRATGPIKVRYLYVWRGPHAATLAADATFRTWLGNGGAGRTDAELAAYTP